MFSTKALETRLWSLGTFLEAWLIVNTIILNVVKGKHAIPSCSWCSWTGTWGKSAKKLPSLLTQASASRNSLETSQTLSAGPTALMHKHVASFAREICTLGARLGCSGGPWKKLRDWAPSLPPAVPCLFTLIHLMLRMLFILVLSPPSHSWAIHCFSGLHTSLKYLSSPGCTQAFNSSLSSLPLRQPPTPARTATFLPLMTAIHVPCTDSNQSSGMKRQNPSRTCPFFWLPTRSLKEQM